ncbi:MAG: general secretion pathway protein GspK [Planctomycetaceae bacterium]|nr:general secretion pathway protein GspK [Planctomycetaceae bacterium]
MKRHHKNTSQQGQTDHPRGFVLLVVLTVIVLLSLSAYQFADRMTTEREVVSYYVEESQCRQAAASGIEYTLALVTSEGFDLMALNETPDVFIARLLSEESDTEPELATRFSIVAGVQLDYPEELQFGIKSEQGKLNLNSIAELDVPLEDQREMLMNLPDMTETIADTILDFIDSDASPRDFGTESDEGSFMVRNAALSSLDELLAIPDITTELLYGEDLNRNGLLDIEEDDGEMTLPLDNADGSLQFGWNTYLTVWGRESNLRSDGTPKINLNMENLDQLQADLTIDFGQELADFVVAYRQSGASQAAEETLLPPSGNRSSPNQITGSSGQSSQSSQSAGLQIRSIFELFDATTTAPNGNQGETLTSPWTTSDLSFMEQVYDTLTLSEGDVTSGRIDINHASYEVLVGLPSSSDALAEFIVSYAGTFEFPSDLLSSGVVDIATMRKIEPFLTTRSGVYRFRSIGFSAQTKIQISTEVVIDIAGEQPLILMYQELPPHASKWTEDQLLGLFE